MDRVRQVLDEVEEGRLGPVHVVEDGDERPLARERGDELPRAPEELLDRKLRAGEADGRRDALDHGVTFILRDEGAEFAARRVRRVVLVDPGCVAHELDERPERDPLPVGEAASAADAGLAGERGRERLDEARLADARVRKWAHEPALAERDRLVEGLTERRELRLPADERRVRPPRVPLPRADGDELIRRHALALPLELERLDRLDLDGIADEPVRELTEQHLHRRRRLLKPRRDVHGVADDEPLARRRVARDDFARIHARAVREANAPDALELVVQRLEGALHAVGGAHGAEGVVLVQPR